MKPSKRMIRAFIIVTFCFVSVGVLDVWAEDESPAGQAQVVRDSLAVHSRMSASSGVVKHLGKGDTVTVQFELEKEDYTWCAVSGEGQADIMGYVLCDCLKRDEKKRSWEYVGSSGEVTYVGNETDVTIPGNHVLVPVTLEYSGREARGLFLLDTGASITAMESEIADELGIDLNKAISVRGMVLGGGTIEVRVVQVSGLKVGPHRMPDAIIGVYVHKGAAADFDGVLGMDFLGSVAYEVDLKNRVIRWK